MADENRQYKGNQYIIGFLYALSQWYQTGIRLISGQGILQSRLEETLEKPYEPRRRNLRGVYTSGYQRPIERREQHK